MQVTQEQLDSSVVNAAVAAAAAGYTLCTGQQLPLQAHGLLQDFQEQQQQQHSCVPAAVAGNARSCEGNPSSIQQSSQPDTAQQQHLAEQQQQQLDQQAGCNGTHSSSTHPCGCRGVDKISSSNGSDSSQLGDVGSAAAAAPGTAAGCVVDRQGERVSLTIRRVIKVHKALGILRR